jgi:formylglycine-generating enzyme
MNPALDASKWVYYALVGGALVSIGVCFVRCSPSVSPSAVDGAGAVVDASVVDAGQVDASSLDASELDASPDATVECIHPQVKRECDGGWCVIPPGCFWSGSPEDEFGRAQTREPLVPITLTRAFLMRQFETTISEWKAVGFNDPTGTYPTTGLVGCKDDNCPVTSISWAESLAYANAKSDQEDRPRCYILEGCTGKVGEGFECTGFRLVDSISYECKGYRLPMGAEREYASRAGTTTAFYSGPITTQADIGTCYPEAHLDAVAWWCQNFNGTTHPVGLKVPNGWGLHDMIGNVGESIIDHDRYRAYGEAPVTDPGDPVYLLTTTRSMRGGFANSWAPILRSASWLLGLGLNDRGDGTGVRLVRTLSPSELDGGAPKDASLE